MDSVVEDFLQDTLCETQKDLGSNCTNVAFVRNMCLSERWNQRLVCTFPLMQWWIAGTLSAVVLVVTYLAEAVSTLVSDKFDHYFGMFSRTCCRKHSKGKIIAYGFILPLGQQMSSLFYVLWIKGIHKQTKRYAF